MNQLILSPLIWLPLLTVMIVVLVRRRTAALHKGGRNHAVSPGTPRRLSPGVYEALLLVSMSTIVLILLVFERRDDTYVPSLFSAETASDVRLTLAAGCIIGLLTITIAVVVAIRRSTVIATLVVGVMFAAGSLIVNVIRSEQESAAFRQRDSIHNLPLLRFEIENCPDGADLFVNGVHVGQTPLSVSVVELFRKIPVWTYDDCRAHNRAEADQDAVLKLPESHRTRWESAHLGLNRRQLAEFDARNVFVAADYNGMKGYTRPASLKTQSKSTHEIALHTRFPVWEAQIEELLDRARMQGYAPSAQWYKAFESYGSTMWARLYELSHDEPEVLTLLDNWARQRYTLQTVDSSSSAIEKLNGICEEVAHDKERTYDSRSLRGRAVDLLVPVMNTSDLVAFAERFAGAEMPRSFSRSVDATSQFFLRVDSVACDRDFLRLLPVVHALRSKDKALDRESATANEIEERFAPVLLRRHCLDEAILLGGPVTEKYLSRQDWRAPVDDDRAYVSVGINENRVNMWFMTLARLDSEAGHRFRREHAGELLDVARTAFGPSNLDDSSVPRSLDFLFLDAAEPHARPSLAMQFWGHFDRILGSDDAALAMRWDYLGKMWPESTPNMFAEAFMQTDSESFWASLPRTMSAADRFAVYFAVYEAVDKRLASNPDEGRTRRHLEKIRREIETLPHAAAASMFIARYESGEYPYTTDHLHEQIRFDTTRHDHVAQLAEHEDPEFRRAALAPIRNHPIPRRLKLLETLVHDSDASVAAEARTIRLELDLLLKAPLPCRQS